VLDVLDVLVEVVGAVVDVAGFVVVGLVVVGGAPVEVGLDDVVDADVVEVIDVVVVDPPPLRVTAKATPAPTTRIAATITHAQAGTPLGPPPPLTSPAPGGGTFGPPPPGAPTAGMDAVGSPPVTGSPDTVVGSSPTGGCCGSLIHAPYRSTTADRPIQARHSPVSTGPETRPRSSSTSSTRSA
jgi:hypothetical protein